MVGKIAVCLTRFLIEKSPECFIGCSGMETVADVKENADVLCGYAEASGLCHDIGKISYDSNPYMSARVFTEDELKIVKMHPETGKKLLSRKEGALNEGALNDLYTDVIVGHHKHYDNINGYPETFDLNASKHKMMIMVIKAADTIDAATDDVGKTYAVAKSLPEVCAEIKTLSEREYSPDIAELLEYSEVTEALEHILTEGRKEAYYTAYSHAWS